MPSAQAQTRTAATALWRALDDIQAMLTACALTALALLLFQAAQLVPGGAVGMALLLHRLSGLALPLAFPLVVAPFYLLALLTLGGGFTVRTAISVGLVTAFTALLPHGIDLRTVQPWLASVLGGLLCGIGILILFRHRASLGGLNVVVLLAHQKLGWKPGYVQAALDAVIVLAGGLMASDATHLLWSLVTVVTMNLVLVANHRARAG